MPEVLTAIISSLAWLAALVAADPHRRDKGGGSRTVAYFLFGTLSVVPALVLELLFDFGAPPSGRPVLDWFFFAVVGTGVIEESSKLLVFVLLERKVSFVREPADGAFLGAAVGLGFAAAENVLYAFWYGPEVALVRGFLTPPDHMLFAAIWGLVYASRIFGRQRLAPKDAGSLALAILSAGFVHGMSNMLLDFGPVASIAFDLSTVGLALFLLRRLLRDSPYGLRNLDDARASIAALDAAFVRDPANPALHLRAAHFRLRTGEAGLAADHLEQYLKARPGSLYAMGLKGAALVLRGDHAAGEALLDRAQELMGPRARWLFRRNLSRLVQKQCFNASLLRAWLAGRALRDRGERRQAGSAVHPRRAPPGPFRSRQGSRSAPRGPFKPRQAS